LSKIRKWVIGLIGGGALICFLSISFGNVPGAVLGAILFFAGIFLATTQYYV